jgi:hypothetical protein
LARAGTERVSEPWWLSGRRVIFSVTKQVTTLAHCAHL